MLVHSYLCTKCLPKCFLDMYQLKTDTQDKVDLVIFYINMIFFNFNSEILLPNIKYLVNATVINMIM